MTGVEIMLLLAGCIFMVGSFFITEKISPSELDRIAKLSEDELLRIVNRGLDHTGAKIEEVIDRQIDTSSEKVERALARETNEKIMAISEYSDTVIGDINKVHNEIMFLYSMLTDKHTELTGMSSDLQRLAADVRNLQSTHSDEEESAAVSETGSLHDALSSEPSIQVLKKSEESLEELSIAGETAMAEAESNNQKILRMYEEGLKEVEIARSLGLGVGEVKLVIGLYRGEGNA